MIRKKHLRFLPALAVIGALTALSVTGCSTNNRTEADPDAGITATPAAGRGKAASYQDNFYDAVNHETLSGWEIPVSHSERYGYRTSIIYK